MPERGDLPRQDRKRAQVLSQTVQLEAHKRRAQRAGRQAPHRRACRARGSVRSFHVGVADKVTFNRILSESVDPLTRLHSDESRVYGDMADVLPRMRQ
jgi:hypothetical protein